MDSAHGDGVQSEAIVGAVSDICVPELGASTNKHLRDLFPHGSPRPPRLTCHIVDAGRSWNVAKTITV